MDVLLGAVTTDTHPTVVLPVPAPTLRVDTPPRRPVLHATAVLAAASGLTVVTLVGVATLVGHWG